MLLAFEYILILENLQRAQRGRSNESLNELNLGPSYGSDQEFVAHLPQEIGFTRKGVDNVAIKKVNKPSWYEDHGTALSNPGLNHTNRVDFSHAYKSSRDPRTVFANRNKHTDQTIMNRIGSGATESWKNSEEEDYIWDDEHSGVIDADGLDNSGKDIRGTEDAENSIKKLPVRRVELSDAQFFGPLKDKQLDSSGMAQPPSIEKEFPALKVLFNLISFKMMTTI